MDESDEMLKWMAANFLTEDTPPSHVNIDTGYPDPEVIESCGYSLRAIARAIRDGACEDRVRAMLRNVIKSLEGEV